MQWTPKHLKWFLEFILFVLFWNKVDRTPLKLGIVSVYCQSNSDFPFSLSLFLKESFEVTSLIADTYFPQYCPKQARNGVTEAKLQTNLKSIISLIFLILCSLCFSCFELLILCSVCRRFFSAPCCGFCGLRTWRISKNQEILNLKMTPREWILLVNDKSFSMLHLGHVYIEVGDPRQVR